MEQNIVNYKKEIKIKKDVDNEVIESNLCGGCFNHCFFSTTNKVFKNQHCLLTKLDCLLSQNKINIIIYFTISHLP